VPVPVPAAEPEPEAGPSTYATSPVTPKQPLLSTDYPIHSPYPDFDDVFMEPNAMQCGFAFSLALDDDELQRLLRLSHEVGGFEPNPFDPLFEELPKLGIPIASLLAAQPREHLGGVYSGPFSPFSPSSPIEVVPMAMPDEAIVEVDLAPRTSSRFEFARRPSVASTGRGQSPFPGRDDWGRTPSSNGYGGDDMRAAMAAAKAAQHGYHPALVHLNSHVAAAAAASAANANAAGDSWGNPNGAEFGQSSYRSYPQQQQQQRSFGNNYGSYDLDSGMHSSHGSHGSHVGQQQQQQQNQQQQQQQHYSGPAPGNSAPHVPPGYETYAQNGPQGSQEVYGQMGYVQQRRY
jgi:hypothetical protein